MSLLFCSYVLLLQAIPLPAISHVGSRLPLSHTFHEHLFVARPSDSLLPSDATRTACEPFLWCHPRKQNGHTRHLVATKVGAVVFATSGQESSECGQRMEPIVHGCRTVSESSTQRHAGMQTLTAAANPTEPACAACTAWGAAAAGDARARESARWDGPQPLPCRCCHHCPSCQISHQAACYRPCWPHPAL